MLSLTLPALTVNNILIFNLAITGDHSNTSHMKWKYLKEE